MTNEQILKKAIEKAFINGFNARDWMYEPTTSYERIVFRHDFAKAFFGTEKTGYSIKPEEEEWQYHLQEMVICEDPIKYLEKFL